MGRNGHFVPPEAGSSASFYSISMAPYTIRQLLFRQPRLALTLEAGRHRQYSHSLLFCETLAGSRHAVGPARLLEVAAREYDAQQSELTDGAIA